MSRLQRSWGAEAINQGFWRFRLWAPGQGEFRVALEGREYPMASVGDGWFECELRARAGMRYAFLPENFHAVPDPASRMQVDDVHGPSVLVDPSEYNWSCHWEGRSWHETLLYELHVGTFSPEGTFDGVRQRLEHLSETGVTAIELCPVSHFAGNRGWGYDGVLPYAPHRAYGTPNQLKELIDRAHSLGIMVFLDVVYNHFGPEGNYLSVYAPEFFHQDEVTPWGAAVAFDRRPVREFFIENALYWLDEYRFDGLRLDAVDQITDRSEEHFLLELSRAVREFGFDRHVHLTTEDEQNITFLHQRDDDGQAIHYDGEWNDDWHHVAHVILTKEGDGYYEDYVADPRTNMAISLAEGFVYQGQESLFKRGCKRGAPSRHLPPTAFVNFLQNHDQIGNRAFGERISTLAEPDGHRVLTACLLLSPHIPLLFMGQEWGETRPFQFFTDFQGNLADAVREGRRREFARWPQFSDPKLRDEIPDPNAIATFERSKLDWRYCEAPAGQRHRSFVRSLIEIRHREIVPRLGNIKGDAGSFELLGISGVRISWKMGDGTVLEMVLNLGGEPFEHSLFGREIFRLNNVSNHPWAIQVAILEP